MIETVEEVAENVRFSLGNKLTSWGGGRGGGALDVVSQIGHAVAGKLFEVSDGYDALDKKEGAPNYYERKEVQVLSENGETQSAITYVVTSDKIKKDHQIPGPGYLEAVEKGYENFSPKRIILDRNLDIKLKSYILKRNLNCIFVS